MQAQQRWVEALEHYQVACEQAERMQLKRALIQISYSTGQLYEAQADGGRARALYERAYQLAQAMSFKLGVELCAAKLGALER